MYKGLEASKLFSWFFLLSIFKLLRSLGIAHFVTSTPRAREEKRFAQSHTVSYASSGLKPTVNQSSFHFSTLTREPTYWLIHPIPAGREALLYLATHSMTNDVFELFCPLLSKEKWEEMEKKSTEQSLADSKSGKVDPKQIHLIEWLAHCVGPELLHCFGRDFWQIQSHMGLLDGS